jgi:alcohol dehydrogenase class IV
MSQTFYFPTKLIISDDAAADLVNVLQDAPDAKILLLTDEGIVQAGIAGPVIEKLEGAGFKPVVYDGIPGNPNLPDVTDAIAALKGGTATHIVALGGGSVIDTAKAVGLLLADAELDYEEVQWRRQTIKKGSLPVIAIPTTAGTGSETTHVAVVGDSKGFKMGVLHPALFTHTAIIDGGLMISLPAKLTAATGMDALVHAIEAYLGKRANMTSDLFALSAIRMAVQWLPVAYKDGGNLEARQNMAVAAAWGGLAFDQSGLGLVHALAGPLCGTYHLHHGLGVATLLPAVLEFDAPAVTPERWEPLREALGLPVGAQPAEMGEWARNFLKGLGMPTGLAELNVEKDTIPEMAEKATRMAMIGINVREAGLEDCIQVLEAAL